MPKITVGKIKGAKSWVRRRICVGNDKSSRRNFRYHGNEHIKDIDNMVRSGISRQRGSTLWSSM